MIIVILFGICVVLLAISTFYSVEKGYFSPSEYSNKFYSSEDKQKIEEDQKKIIEKYINKLKIDC